MTQQAIIERTIKVMNQLPKEKAEEISDFVDFIYKRYEELILSKGIQQLITGSQTFQFLLEDEETYSI